MKTRLPLLASALPAASRARLACLLLALATSLTGCVSSKYKLAEYERRPVALDLTASPGAFGTDAPEAFTAVVKHVLVFQGPGSWKRNAYWDEYVLAFADHARGPVTIDSVTLTDFQGRPVEPGRDPWLLEKESRDYESGIADTLGDVFQIGGGIVLASASGMVAGGTVAAMAGAGGWTALGVIGTAGLVAIPAYAVGTIYRNVSNKHKIEEEFTRRALVLPFALAPGKPAEGSLFFRLTPGPRRLTLHCHVGEEARDLVIDLAPLASLHLKQPLAAQPRATSAPASSN